MCEIQPWLPGWVRFRKTTYGKIDVASLEMQSVAIRKSVRKERLSCSHCSTGNDLEQYGPNSEILLKVRSSGDYVT